MEWIVFEEVPRFTEIIGPFPAYAAALEYMRAHNLADIARIVPGQRLPEKIDRPWTPEGYLE